MKKIIIQFDETGINMLLEGALTRTEIIGALTMANETLIKESNVKIIIVQPQLKKLPKKSRAL